MRTLSLVVLLLTVSAFAQKEKQPPPDTVFVDGNIYLEPGSVYMCNGPILSSGTQAWCGEQPTRTMYPAMAVQSDRIVAVGTNEKILALKGKNTQVVDLHGRFVMPGFNDAHLHFAAGGLEKTRVNLIGVKSLEEMKQRIAAAAKQAAPGEWIAGRGWDETLWDSKKLPTRWDIDDITGGHPAFFSRVDGHAALVNSAALKSQGVTQNTPDPPGGSYTRDANGEPTGMVREAAWDQFHNAVPKPTLSQRRRGIELAMQEAREWGLTSVQDSMTAEDDPTEWDDFLIYEDLEREGKLTVRITRWLGFHDPLDVTIKHRAHHPQDDPMLHTGMIGEVYLDGSLGSRSAALLKPYADDPGNTGILRADQAALNRKSVELALDGFQIGYHAIGDRGLQVALDAIAEAENRYDAKYPNSFDKLRAAARRFRVEHEQVVDPPQIQQMAKLGVVASIQPCHLLTDMRWAESRLGPERAKTSYPWRSLVKAGVVLAFGTDFAVEPMNPFRGLYAAITRKSEDGRLTYYPEQKLTVDEAVRAYTWGSAYAEFAEEKKGTLAPGMLADFIVLDRDITKVPPEELLKTKVLETYVGGKKVYSRPAD